jgi:hemerythrin-like metal-binding protein/PAS domain S-box-containing protein
MRKSLQLADQEDNKRKIEDLQRSWTTEGLAKFGEILRHHTENIKELSNDIIINLVKYLNANQGGIFILNDSNVEDIHLELLSSYAYNRKKYITKKIRIGDGLVGAVALEKYTIYMTDIPNEYVEIESGIGSANPRSILIVPLKIEEEILGVIELASFNELQKHEIHLVERIAESIASTLSTARINTRTAELLEQSKKQAYEMHEQEEQMRQTIQDLLITQEDGIKKEEKLSKALDEIEIAHKELEIKDRQLQIEIDKLRKENKENIDILTKRQKHSIDILQTTMDGVIIFDENGNIEFFNTTAQKMWGYKNTEIIGRNITKILKFKFKENIEQSEFIEKEVESIIKENGTEFNILKNDGEISSVFVTVSKNELQEGIRYTMFAKDLSKLKEKEAEKTKLMEEIMAKEFKYMVRIEQLEENILRQGFDVPNEADVNELIRWNDSYSIDLSIIDKQHLKWIEIINKLFKLFREGKASKKLDDIYKELIDYTEYHFGFEEKYLSDFKYEHFKSHKQTHDNFIKTIKEYYEQHKSGKFDIAYHLLIFLKKWVKNHIQEQDKAYVQCFKNNGLS